LQTYKKIHTINENSGKKIFIKKYKVINIKRWIKDTYLVLTSVCNFLGQIPKSIQTFCPLLSSLSKFLWSCYTFMDIKLCKLDWDKLKIFAYPLFNSNIGFGKCMTKTNVIEIIFQPQNLTINNKFERCGHKV